MATEHMKLRAMQVPQDKEPFSYLLTDENGDRLASIGYNKRFNSRTGEEVYVLQVSFPPSMSVDTLRVLDSATTIEVKGSPKEAS